jgi:hypothetical protein
MDSTRRGTVLLGLALVLLGGLALAGRLLDVDLLSLGWPIFVLAPGIVLFAAGVAVGGKGGLGLAIPGGIVTMAGAVLTFQSATGLWSTWAYAWALVAPGGVGIAFVLYGLLTGQRDIARGGVPILLTGLGLFIGFGLFFEGLLNLNGANGLAEPLLAAALVGLGIVVILLGLFRGAPGRTGPSSSDRPYSTDTTR